MPSNDSHRLDVLALGEAMIEFNQQREGDGRIYLQGFGGDTSNFAIAAARQGARAGYLSSSATTRTAGCCANCGAAKASTPKACTAMPVPSPASIS